MKFNPKPYGVYIVEKHCVGNHEQRSAGTRKGRKISKFWFIEARILGLRDYILPLCCAPNPRHKLVLEKGVL